MPLSQDSTKPTSQKLFRSYALSATQRIAYSDYEHIALIQTI